MGVGANWRERDTRFAVINSRERARAALSGARLHEREISGDTRSANMFLAGF
jgi:hypothetical protein